MTVPLRIHVWNIVEDVSGMVLPPSLAKRKPSPWKGANSHFLSWIETFYVVASTRHFTSAAIHLGYSQTTVTVHIKALEGQLGVTLFERYRFSKSIVLTKAGQCALEYAARLMALADEMKTAAQGPDIEGELADSR
jgi:DNA-binding transcriptional ArsR family regulator